MLKTIRKWLIGWAGSELPTKAPVAVHPKAQAGNPPATLGVARNYYEALTTTPDRTPINISMLSALASFMAGLNRQQLAALGQYLYDNYGVVAYTVDTIANYCTPIVPQAATPDAEANKLYDAYWDEWTQQADFSGRFSFAKLQRLWCKCMDIHGDVGISATTENGFVQLQTWEGWRIGNALKHPNNDPFYHDGVVVDAKGRVVEYHIDNGGEKPLVIPASAFWLLNDADRYSSYRGCTPMRRGMNDIRDAQDIKGFEKLAIKVSSALVGVVQGGPLEEDVWGHDTDEGGNLPDSKDSERTQQEKKLTLAELLGGDIPVLPEGQVMQALNGGRTANAVPQWLDLLAAAFVMGTGLPPAFIIDQGLTGPNQRSVNGKAQRRFDARQADLGALVEWVWRRVIADGIASGRLPPAPMWYRMEWQGPRKVSIDDGRDAIQEREDLMTGLITRQNHYGNRSLNWKRETDQAMYEDDYIIEQCMMRSQKYGVPLDMLLARFGFGRPSGMAIPTTKPEAVNEQEKK